MSANISTASRSPGSTGPRQYRGALPFDVDNFLKALPRRSPTPARRAPRRSPKSPLPIARRSTASTDLRRRPTHQSARYRIQSGDDGGGTFVQRPDRGDRHRLVGLAAVADGRGSLVRSGRGPAAFRGPRGLAGRSFGAALTGGEVTAGRPLVIRSRMECVIFADGIEADAIRFDAGVVATIRPAARARCG